ncbi:MAG: type III pantothenate kinase [Thermodesulfovibrionales bacterium]
MSNDERGAERSRHASEPPETRKMILTLDIGNSRVKAGVFAEGRLRVSAVRTHPLREASDYLLELGVEARVDRIVISSVVTPLTAVFRAFAHEVSPLPPIVVDHLLNMGLTYAVASPEQVGADRIANAVGGYCLFHGPVIIADFGTATTLTVVGGDGRFLGGSILPGCSMMAEVLREKTSRLPLVDLVEPTSALGKDTVHNIQSGVFFGMAGAVERLVEEIGREIGYNMNLVLTGGMCGVFGRFIRGGPCIEPMLTTRGLLEIYSRVDGVPLPRTIMIEGKLNGQ